MDENFKKLARTLVTLPVSQRLLRDFMEDLDRNIPPDTDARSVPEMVDEHLNQVGESSPTFARQLGQPSVQGDRILISKASDVSTPIERLAELLQQGIKNGADHKVKVRPVDHEFDPQNKPRVNHVEIIYVPDEVDRKVDRLRNLNAHRVVHVKLPDSPARDVPPFGDVLLGRCISPDGRPRSTAYIPTIIAPKPEPFLIPFETVPFDEEDGEDHEYREHRHAAILYASDADPTTIPDVPDEAQIDRWGRNVMFRQVAFATSGGGACAYQRYRVTRASGGRWTPGRCLCGT